MHNLFAACAEREIRLIGGANSNEGFVEMCSDDSEWAATCGDYTWSNYVAAAFCRLLGLNSVGLCATELPL